MTDKLRCYICGKTKNEVSKFYNASKISDGKPVCNKHYIQLRRKGRIIDPTPSRRSEKRICDVCKSDNKVIQYRGEGDYQGWFLCLRHKSQVRLYGKILERTVFDKNEIVEHEQYAEVKLYDKKQNHIKSVLIDLKDIDIVSKYKWRYDRLHGYAIAKDENGSHLSMHVLIANRDREDCIVDHIDRDKLNNRRHNLRKTNKSVNGINSNLRKKNTSGVTGVSWSNFHKKWRSYINFEGNRIELGLYSEKIGAIKSRLFAEAKYYPDHPPQEHLFVKFGIGGES